jgi:hypothetical protein
MGFNSVRMLLFSQLFALLSVGYLYSWSMLKNN